jgi:hypothetical protein
MKDFYARRPSLKVRGMQLLISLLRPIAVPIELMFHKDVGERYVGFGGFLAFGALLACCWVPHNGLMIFITCVYGIKALGHQEAGESRRQHGGLRQHTRRSGVPLWGLLRNKMTEDHAVFCEMWLLLVLGGIAAYFNQTAGPYLMIAGVVSCVIRQLRQTIEREVVLDRVDELLEQEELNRKIEEHLGPDWNGFHQDSALDPKVIELSAQVTRRALLAMAPRNGELLTSAD